MISNWQGLRGKPLRVGTNTCDQLIAMSVTENTLFGLADILQSNECRLLRALLYPAGSTQPRIILLPARTGDLSTPPWVSDFNLIHWFPGGNRQVHIRAVPATDFALRNAYTIVTGAPCPHLSMNRSLHDNLGLNVRGNLLVFRHSARRRLSVVNVHNAERRLIELVLHRCVVHSSTIVCDTLFLTHRGFVIGGIDSS